MKNFRLTNQVEATNSFIKGENEPLGSSFLFSKINFVLLKKFQVESYFNKILKICTKISVRIVVTYCQFQSCKCLSKTHLFDDFCGLIFKARVLENSLYLSTCESLGLSYFQLIYPT